MEKAAVYNLEFREVYKLDNSEISFLNDDSPETFSGFNPIIILGGTLNLYRSGFHREAEGKEKATAEAARVEREVFNALDSGSIVCVTFLMDELTFRILHRIRVPVEEWSAPVVDLKVKRSEFSSFLRKFGGTRYYFMAQVDDVIYETASGCVTAFATKVGKGVLVFVPCHILYEKLTDITFIIPFLRELLNALRTYGPRVQYSPPKWVDGYRFVKEAAISSEIKELEKEIHKKTDLLNKYLKMKEILWFRDTELVHSIIDFFKKIGFQTKRDEISEEDFWITEGNKETVIVEVKGLDKNLTRQHISQLDEHRAAREKPDDFPALLVLNSFNKAISLKEKDVSVSPNEVKKAVHTNVLVVRTLDLCNAFSLIENGKLPAKTLLDTILREHGWLRITESRMEVIKR